MIRILPEILSNQIAAGEVVQRPSSVVKELVENSIDAGAGRIIVEIEKGGKSLIRVSDDGRGLDRDQALLAIERYATSKIFAKEDLFSISTFGFRGEALPSIASVSRFRLVSRTRGADAGTRIDISGGKLTEVSETGAPGGTMVEVRHLFFNTPARRKFLKTDATESGHIADAVSGLALGSPGVGFRLLANQKTIRQFPSGQDLFHRAMLVLGSDVTGRLYGLDPGGAGEAPGRITVAGAVANPSVTRSTANRIYLFVNNRLVWDRGLVAAVFQGFRGRIMKGRYPMGVICVNLPYDQVDVNVHPSKREIKFLSPAPVYQAVTSAVEKALEKAQENIRHYASPLAVSHGGGVREPEAKPVFIPDNPTQGLPGTAPMEKPFHTASPGPFETSVSPVSQPSTPAGHHPGQPEQALQNPKGWDAPVILGQVMGTYIVVQKAEELLLIDQHAAHERVVYEALKRRHRGLPFAGQSLLVPETLELGHREADRLKTVLEDLAKTGLEIEPFGGTTFVVKSAPMLLSAKSVKGLVTDIVETLMETGDPASTTRWLEDCLTTMACHHAVRAGKSMGPEEMSQLVTDLFACANPLHCPHGRPTLVSFDKGQMEKLFKRVV